MNEKSVHVLMTGAGAPGAAGIIKCLQQDWIKLTVADADTSAIGKHLCADFVQIPKGDDKNFIDEVLKVALQKNIDLIVPLVTKELLPFASNKELFKQNKIDVLVSSAAAIETANNKAACYRFLQSKGITVPKYFVVNTTEEFIHAAFELGHPQQSFVFKPSVANGSRGVRIVSDSIDESEQLFEHKPYNLFITYAHALKILSSKSFPQLLVSEYLPGDEYTVDCLADNGNSKLIVPRLRQKMVNGISVQGSFVQDQNIIEYCKKIIETIGLHGNIGIQVKHSKDNQPLLLEINPRLQGTTVAALGAGINFPVLGMKQQLALPISDNEMMIKWGTSFSRHWTEVFY